MTEEIKRELDTLVSNLRGTFSNEELFRPEDDDERSLWAYSDDLDYPIEEYLIDCGSCNWENINYVEQAMKVYIHAGERDSFGWLTGVITMGKHGKNLNICYG